jgi:hypothetical protein
MISFFGRSRPERTITAQQIFARQALAAFRSTKVTVGEQPSASPTAPDLLSTDPDELRGARAGQDA